MRRVVKKILQILDGTPAVYGHRTRGQSVVELALVSPILIVLIMGLAEIGWFANNYLILLETTRVGARYGTVQSGDTSPMKWNNAASISPNIATVDPSLNRYRSCPDVTNLSENVAGFYNILACVMLQSMSPLQFQSQAFTNDPNYQPPAPPLTQVDDIVISAFSLQLIDPTDPNIPTTLKTALNKSLMTSIPSNVPQVLVVGRYPTNANECDVAGSPIVERDPFDYIQDGGRDFTYPNGSDPAQEINRNYLEELGYDTAPENQRGFDWAGRHVITATANSTNKCYGSEWSIDQVQQLVNLPDFQLLNASQRQKLASQGMVLVEMFWRHSLLLKNPVFDPVFTLLGDNTIISVWSAFPVPAIEPRIKFQQLPLSVGMS